MPRIHLIEGPVGAGKSTYAAALAGRIGGVHIALDEWFARLFSPDRPNADVMTWYAGRKARLVDLLWSHALVLLESGAKPILELGLVQYSSRKAIYQKAAAVGVELQVHVLVASRQVRRERVVRRNDEKGPTFSMVVPEPIFELASDAWQHPDAKEMAEHRIEVIRTDA